MSSDPYATLGLSREATEEEIRRAFRRLAKELHPDVNPGDASAAERFKQVSQAYDLLGDPAKRRRFDRGEIDASGDPRHTYAGAGAHRARGAGPNTRGPADDMGFGDIFSDLFGNSGRGGRGGFGGGTRGQDIRYTLEIDFLEAVGGARKRVTMPDGTVLDMTVPVGVEDGRVLRLKGKGTEGVGNQPNGDALVEIKVRPHAKFQRDGDNILSDLPITLDEAILGDKIEVQTTSGTVNLTVPKGTSSGRTFRLRGKGIKNATSGTTGDHLVTIQIVLPDEIDDSLAYYITEWRQSNRYSPRD